MATVGYRAELRYQPGVAYAYQYRTDRIAPVAIVTPAPVILRPVIPVPNHHPHQLYGAIPSRLATTIKPPTPQFPTRRPVAATALDRLHTRVDIRHQEKHREVHQPGTRVIATPAAVLVHAVPAPASTIVSHSHTEVYRKYH